jgi:hypothetical protein
MNVEPGEIWAHFFYQEIEGIIGAKEQVNGKSLNRPVVAEYPHGLGLLCCEKK